MIRSFTVKQIGVCISLNAKNSTNPKQAWVLLQDHEFIGHIMYPHTQKYFLVHTKFYKPEYQNLELKQGIGTTAQGNTHKNNPNNSYWYVRECRAS